jgi:F-type H+-transporting ATPase subunit delta
MAITGDAKVARRYAAALFDAVAEGGDEAIEAAGADLNVIEEMLKNIPYLRAVLLQPLVTDERKNTVIRDAFASRLGELPLNFLLLLIRKRREGLIDQIIADFRRLADERAGRVEAFVESSVALTDDQVERLQAALHQRTGKTVKLTASVDARMLGGVRVRIGDSIIDGALSSQLERIRHLLLAAR